jgi:hypothetical protein
MVSLADLSTCQLPEVQASPTLEPTTLQSRTLFSYGFSFVQVPPHSCAPLLNGWFDKHSAALTRNVAKAKAAGIKHALSHNLTR